MNSRDRFFICNRWVAPTGTAGRLEVHEAGTGEVMGQVPAGGPADVAAAVAAASAALGPWSRTPVDERADCLQRIAAGLRAREDELARTITREVGMPIRLARRIQVGLPISTFANCAARLREFSFEQRVGHSLVLREPVGVVAAITPWNYPLHQIALKVAPALAAGCTVVLKPSEVAPFNAFVLAEVALAAGLPEGVFNLVTGLGSVVGEALAAHPGVNLISFTGSTAAGRRVAELAAPNVTRLALELGGKSASLVLDDADLPLAVKSTLNGCFLNSGQTCTALSRLLVPERLHGEAVDLAVGLAQAFVPDDPLLDSTRLGPLSSAAQLQRVRGYISKGIEEGAQLASGGAEPPEGVHPGGYFVKPTVFGAVNRQATLAQAEIFGPVLAILPYADDQDALRMANGTPYGLAGAVWSGDEDRARQFARGMRAGQIDVNGGAFNPDAPFGGFKQSGYGREGGVFGLEGFLEYKSLQLRAGAD